MEENSIKETIKIIERKIKEAENYSDITGLYLTLDEELCNAFINILSDYKRILKENEELKKYDIRNIKIDKDKIIRSPNFTRKEVDLMNLGIALNLNADKLFNEESEEDDI